MNRIFKLLRLILTKKLIFFLCLFFLLSFLATFGELISAYLISNYISSSLYTDFYISNSLNYFVLNPQFIFLFVLLTGFARFSSLFILPRLSTFISSRITTYAFKKYYESSIEFKEIYSFNEIQTTFSLRSAQLTGGVVYTSLNIINFCFVFLVFIFYLLNTQPFITLSIIISAVSLYIGSILIFRENLKTHYRIMNTYNQSLIGFIDSSLRDERYASINLDRSKIIGEYNILDFKLRNSSTQLTFLSSLPRVFIDCLFFLGLLLFGVLFTKLKGDSISNFPNLIILLACFQRLIPSLQGIYSNFLGLKANYPALNYFLDFINSNSKDVNLIESKNVIKVDDKNNTIFESKELLYKYRNNKILSYPELKIFKGDFVIIKGISGKGKTTWIDLLLGLRNPYSGVVTRNFDLNSIIYLNFNVSKEDILKSYDSYFYKFSKLSLKKSTKFRIDHKKLMNICGIDFLKKKQNIFSGQLSVKGLSSGQYQRIQLYMALSLNPKILILDEALNAIELELEHKIIRNIREYFEDLTLLQITHRPYQREFYNRVYDLD